MSLETLPESPEEFLSNNKNFLGGLVDHVNWAKIPLLNYTPLHKLKNKSIVRFRGMIQDMQDPEIYMERYEVVGSDGSSRMQEGKYRDCLVLRQDEQVNYESKRNVQGDRRTLFVVSVPGLNSWANSYEEECNSANINPFKCTFDLGSHTEELGRKGLVNSDYMDIDTEITPNDRKNQTLESTRLYEHKETKGVSGKGHLNPKYLLNLPLSDRPGTACMVKIYSDFDAYTLNCLVDVVGFLSVDPALAADEFNEDALVTAFDNFNEYSAHNPPPYLIPRLHAIALHKLLHSNPLLDTRLTIDYDKTAIEFNMYSVQKDLRMLLALCMFNDDLAADYLLSHLISTVYNRSDFGSVGKFALNICNIPQEVLPDYTGKLYEILELLLPASHYLALTLDNMNTKAFVPKKDYETNKLVSGILQLAPHTHLVLDETKMQQGRLDENGVKGIQSLAHLIKEQQIKCNFQYYDIDYNVDIPVLVLSEGRSMLPSDFILPLEVDKDAKQHIMETYKAALHYLQPEKLNQFRRFITTAQITEFTMNPETGEMIQTDFVQMRKTNASSSPDDLHALLVLSRLLAIARGKKVLDKESWMLAREMEAKRTQRAQNLPKLKRHLYN